MTPIPTKALSSPSDAILAQTVTDRDEVAIAQTVDALRSYMQVQSGVLFDYFELLEVYGLRVVVLPLPDDLDGFSYYDPPHRNAFLFVNADMNPERQLFRLCYELGHVCLFASASRSDPHPENSTPAHPGTPIPPSSGQFPRRKVVDPAP